MHRTTASISCRNPALCRGVTYSSVPLMAYTMLQSSSTAKQLFCQAPCKTTRQYKPFTVASRQRAVGCQAQQITDVFQSRRAMAAVLTAAPLLLIAQKASALIPANDDEDEELVSKAKANRQKRIVEEKDTEQDFAKKAGYNGVTLLTIERGVKKLAKSGSELEAGDLSSVAKLVSDSWVSEFKKAADSVSTSADSKSAISSAFSSINKLSSSAQQGDSRGAKQAFVGAVSSLQSWASGSGLQVKGL